MATHGDPYRKLNKDESVLRSRADTREFKQRCIDTFVELKISYTRLIALLGRNKLPDTDRHPISSDPIRQQWAELETLLLYTISKDVPQINTPLPQSLPITGDIPEIMDNVTQGQPSKLTTHQHELNEQEIPPDQKIILRGQEAIRQHFHAHSQQMPASIEMSLTNHIKITNLLEQGKFFPETYEQVQVHSNLFLDDSQFICK